MTAVAERPATDLDRDNPHLQWSRDAEMAVLGAMMLSKDAIAELVGTIKRDHFYDTRNVAIFDKIVEMFNRDEPADPYTVGLALPVTTLQKLDGGAAYLTDCTQRCVDVRSGTHHAGIVINYHRARALVESGAYINQLGREVLARERDVNSAVDAAQHSTFKLSDLEDNDGPVNIPDLFQAAMDTMEADGDVVPTGFADLDRLLTGGLRPGQLVIVGGKPGLGKSITGTDLARAASVRHGIPSAIFSLEMTKAEVTTRILAAEARIPLTTLRSGQLTDDDWTKLARRMGDLADIVLFVDDDASMNLSLLRARVRKLKQKYGIKLVVIDYLQLLTPASRGETRQQEVAEISRGLKLLAKDLGVVVVALSQLKRGDSDGRTPRPPVLSDLRESGGLEQDADIVILLHREDYYDKESPRAGEVDFIVAKHRNGATDTITVAGQLHLARFVDMATS